ncbi:MAG: 4Fe-4S dicluster domain-containing protein [Ruminococcaceae bacterium]|nr:4Fe-4S dicluster domain-containing protein [Oscillospiraceae bacterium]
MNRVQLKQEDCCGCGACANRCPKQAIVMTADAEGFLYPQIDDTRCVDCGLCKQACPVYNEHTPHGYDQQYYAAQHLEDEIVQTSSSGGVFAALTAAVLDQGGTVYGAAFGENMTVRHERAQTAEEALRFRGSKYVQSAVGTTYTQVKDDLCAGKTVLFSGTPCQVDGLLQYLRSAKAPTDHLLTCDFVCHGTPSPKVWGDYIGFLTERHGSLESYNFRGKQNGWHKYFPAITAGGEAVSDRYRTKESFFKLYSSCRITRPSCYSCRYTSYDRRADLTLADFWNIDKAAPEMDDDRGTSQVIVNTEKGAKWFEACQQAVRHKACTKEDVWQPHLEYPIKRPKAREAFWQFYREQSFEAVIGRYGQDSFVTKCRVAVMPLINKLGLYALAGKLYRVVFVRNKK